MIFSLVVPTLNRVIELTRLLDSIASQKTSEFGPREVEVLIVDQNGDDRLSPVVDGYRDRLSIVHMKAPSLGQSNAKNIGMRAVRGKYVGFPDDDCFYEADTLEKAYRAFRETNDGYALFGRGSDKESGRYLLRYPENARLISSPKDPSVFLGLQIAQFYTAEMARQVGDFDVDLCSGGKWGSGEETDFAIRFLRTGGRIQYRPEILVHHPLVIPETMPIEKLRHYSVGYGALCRKQGLFGLFILKAVKQVGGALFYLLRLDLRRARTCAVIVLGRLNGFWSYSKKTGTRP